MHQQAGGGHAPDSTSDGSDSDGQPLCMALMLAARCCCGTASNACSVLRTHPATNAPVETTVSGKTNFASPRLEGQTHVDELWYQHSAELPCLRPQTSDQTWAQSIRGHAPHPGTNPEDACHQGHVAENPSIGEGRLSALTAEGAART